MRKITNFYFYLVLVSMVINCFIVGCANAVSQPRQSYILANPHGWIEFSVADNEIPERPAKGVEKNPGSKPPSCYLSIRINNEPYIREYLNPTGERAPYKIQTGFRFPVPQGEVRVVANYSNCDYRGGESTGIEESLAVTIEKDTLIPVHFDGSDLSVGTSRKDTVVTLDTINDRLKQLEQTGEKK